MNKLISILIIFITSFFFCVSCAHKSEETQGLTPPSPKVIAAKEIPPITKIKIKKKPIKRDNTKLNKLLSKNRYTNLNEVQFTNNDGYTYKGKNDLVIYFPPNVFDCNEADVVTLQIGEYLDKNTMLKSNLSTQSNGKLIETNGMVYCAAFANNKELKIKKGKEFRIAFNDTKRTDFQLFEGVKNDGDINWINPKPAYKKAKMLNKVQPAIITDRAKKPSFYVTTYGSETGVDTEIIDSAIRFQKDSSSIFGKFIDKYKVALSELIPTSPDASILMYFSLTTDGKLVFKETDSELPAAVNQKFIRYFESMPPLNGYINPATGASEVLEIYFNLTPNIPLASTLAGDALNTELQKEVAARDMAEVERLKQENELIEKQKIEDINKEYKLLVRNDEISDKIKNRLKFNSTSLGWINCDRFYSDPRPKSSLFFTGLEDYSSYQVKIVFTQINSIMNATTDSVNSIPIKEPLHLILVGFKGTDLYVQSKKIRTSFSTTVQFSAEKIEASKLDDYLDKCI